MRIVTFNIRTAARDKWPWNKHFWVRRMREFCKFVKAEDPDVICLQEVTRLQLWCIKHIKSYKIYTNKIGKGIFGECQPIMVSKSFGIGSRSFNMNIGGQKMSNAVVVEIETVSERWVGITNVHLSLDGESRKKEMERVKDGCAWFGIDIICGDFNAAIGDVCFMVFDNTMDIIMPPHPTYVNYENGNKAVIDGFVIRKSLGGCVFRSLAEISDHYPVGLIVP